MLDGCGFSAPIGRSFATVRNGLISYAVLAVMWAWNDFLCRCSCLRRRTDTCCPSPSPTCRANIRGLPAHDDAGTIAMMRSGRVPARAEILLEGIANSGLKM
jgi:hypothetical protein